MTEEEIVDFIDNLVNKKLQEKQAYKEPQIDIDFIMQLFDRLEIHVYRAVNSDGFQVRINDPRSGYHKICTSY